MDKIELQNRKARVAKEILDIAESTLLVNMRFLNVAFTMLNFEKYDGTIATNARTVYFNPDYIIDLYKSGKEETVRAYLHILLHCIFRHPFSLADARYWNLASDIAVESIICEWGLPCTSVKSEESRRKCAEEIKEKTGFLTAEKIYAYLMSEQIPEETLQSWEKLFGSDNHSEWGYKLRVKHTASPQKTTDGADELKAEEVYSDNPGYEVEGAENKGDTAEEAAAESESGIGEEVAAESKSGIAEEAAAESESGIGEEAAAESKSGIGEEAAAENESSIVEEAAAESESSTGEKAGRESESSTGEETDSESEDNLADKDDLKNKNDSASKKDSERKDRSAKKDNYENKGGDANKGGSAGEGRTANKGGSANKGIGDGKGGSANKDNGDGKGSSANKGNGDGKGSSADKGGSDSRGRTANKGGSAGDGRTANKGNGDGKGSSANKGSGDGKGSSASKGSGDGKGGSANESSGDGKGSYANRNGLQSKNSGVEAVDSENNRTPTNNFSTESRGRVADAVDYKSKITSVARAKIIPAEAEDISRKWKELAERIQTDLETFSAEWGQKSDSMAMALKEVNREKYNYEAFLKKFAVMNETMKINQDEFDYVFYTLGLNLYGNMPLVEPLEYKDVKQIREFVIAIDTSGSVAGEKVQAFIRKTYNILKQQESYSRKINIHIIQCDAEIKKDTKITNLSELENYFEDMKLYGFGGTDFRPVFAYVNQLIDMGEFTNLKGLIYFTDGNGIFPERKPKYNTAFVFIDDAYNNYNVPPWAIKLILDPKDI